LARWPRRSGARWRRRKRRNDSNRRFRYERGYARVRIDERLKRRGHG
jgi:hypothetical protein